MISLLHGSSNSSSIDDLRDSDSVQEVLVGRVVELGGDGVDVECQNIDHELSELNVSVEIEEKKEGKKVERRVRDQEARDSTQRGKQKKKTHSWFPARTSLPFP